MAALTACRSTCSPVCRRICSWPFISTLALASMFSRRVLPREVLADSCTLTARH